jgi:hypothetical protein
MEDREILGRIAELAKEEHELYHQAGKGGLSAREHELLRQLQVKPGRVLGPPQAAPDAQGGGHEIGRRECGTYRESHASGREEIYPLGGQR